MCIHIQVGMNIDCGAQAGGEKEEWETWAIQAKNYWVSKTQIIVRSLPCPFEKQITYSKEETAKPTGNQTVLTGLAELPFQFRR